MKPKSIPTWLLPLAFAAIARGALAERVVALWAEGAKRDAVVAVISTAPSDASPPVVESVRIPMHIREPIRYGIHKGRLALTLRKDHDEHLVCLSLKPLAIERDITLPPMATYHSGIQDEILISENNNLLTWGRHWTSLGDELVPMRLNDGSIVKVGGKPFMMPNGISEWYLHSYSIPTGVGSHLKLDSNHFFSRLSDHRAVTHLALNPLRLGILPLDSETMTIEPWPGLDALPVEQRPSLVPNQSLEFVSSEDQTLLLAPPRSVRIREIDGAPVAEPLPAKFADAAKVPPEFGDYAYPVNRHIAKQGGGTYLYFAAAKSSETFIDGVCRVELSSFERTCVPAPGAVGAHAFRASAEHDAIYCFAESSTGEARLMRQPMSGSEPAKDIFQAPSTTYGPIILGVVP